MSASQILKILRTKPQRFTYPEIAAMTHHSVDYVRSAVARFKASGAISGDPVRKIRKWAIEPVAPPPKPKPVLSTQPIYGGGYPRGGYLKLMLILITVGIGGCQTVCSDNPRSLACGYSDPWTGVR